MQKYNRSAEKNYLIEKMIRTAVGGETVLSLANGTDLIANLGMTAAPLVNLEGFVEFKIPVSYERALNTLDVCGKTPSGKKQSYLFALKEAEYDIHPISRGIIDLEEAREMVGVINSEHFDKYDGFKTVLSKEIAPAVFMKSGLASWKTLARCDDGEEKITRMQLDLLKKIGLSDSQKALEMTLRNQQWLGAAADYTGWLFEIVKERMGEFEKNDSSIRPLVDLYAGIWKK